MHDKFGFTREGYLREHVIKNGKREDVCFIAMLKKEWKMAKKNFEEKLHKKGLL